MKTPFIVKILVFVMVVSILWVIAGLGNEKAACLLADDSTLCQLWRKQ